MKLNQVCSNLFLYLVTFRRQVRKGMTPELEQVKSSLHEIFAEQERMVRDDANLEKLYQKIRYILVVLADEILINSDWAYSSAWQDHLFEWEFFKTRLAGEEFFTRLENEGERDEALAEIYYLALCLGFTGKYSDDPKKIQDLKWRLYRMLPNRFSDADTLVTPDAYFVGEGAKDTHKPLVNLGRVFIVCAVLLIGVFMAYWKISKDTVADITGWAKDMRRAVSLTDKDAKPSQDISASSALKPGETSHK